MSHLQFPNFASTLGELQLCLDWFVEIMFQVPACFPALHWHRETGEHSCLFCIFSSAITMWLAQWVFEVKDTIISSLAQFPHSPEYFLFLLFLLFPSFLSCSFSLSSMPTILTQEYFVLGNPDVLGFKSRNSKQKENKCFYIRMSFLVDFNSMVYGVGRNQEQSSSS